MRRLVGSEKYVVTEARAQARNGQCLTVENDSKYYTIAKKLADEGIVSLAPCGWAPWATEVRENKNG